MSKSKYGIEVQIEISMGYIAIWENLTKKNNGFNEQAKHGLRVKT